MTFYFSFSHSLTHTAAICGAQLLRWEIIIRRPMSATDITHSTWLIWSHSPILMQWGHKNVVKTYHQNQSVALHPLSPQRACQSNKHKNKIGFHILFFLFFSSVRLFYPSLYSSPLYPMESTISSINRMTVCSFSSARERETEWAKRCEAAMWKPVIMLIRFIVFHEWFPAIFFLFLCIHA